MKVLLILFTILHLGSTHEPRTAPGWTPVLPQEDILCDLTTTPLQIKTAGGLTGEKEVNVEVKFEGAVVKLVVVKLETPPSIQIGGCTEGPLKMENVSHLAGSEVVVWTLSKTDTELTVVSNNVPTLVYTFGNSTTFETCIEFWNKSAVSVAFSPQDTGSDERRIRPENCTSLSSWTSRFSPDKQLPVRPGTVIGVKCDTAGFWNIGDNSITCNTNLYSDFEFQKEPWCLGVSGAGVEVVRGAETTLTCTLTNLPPDQAPTEQYGLEWSRGDDVITSGVEVGPVKDQARDYFLRIDTTEKSSNYRCYIRGKEGWGVNVPLNVYQISAASKDTQKGVSTDVKCLIENIHGTPYHPQLIWKLNNQTLASNDKFKISPPNISTHSLSSTLTVGSPGQDNTFICEVRSGKFPKSPAAQREVSLFTYTLTSEMLLRDQDKAVVACKVHHVRDLMTVTWFKNGEVLSGSLDSLSGGVQQSVLVTDHTQTEEAVYTCKVESTARPSSPSSSIFVKLGAVAPPPPAPSPNILSSPVLWVLVVTVVALASAVTGLIVYIRKSKTKISKLSLRVSTREKLDSMSERPSTLIRNRAAVPRDIESLRRTLDRNEGFPKMSDLNDGSFD